MNELVPPHRYSVVNPGISRGSYPTLRNFKFLRRLQLKLIVSLIPEGPTTDLISFADNIGCKVVHIPTTRTCVLNEQLLANLVQIINLVIDETNHPVYVHCLDGRRITSVFVILLRRIQGWSPLPALSEYWRFQVSNKAPLPANEIEKSTKDLEKFVADCSTLSVVLPEVMPKWLWNGDRNAAASVNVRINDGNASVPTPGEDTK